MVVILITPPFLMVSMSCCSCQGPLVFWSTEGSSGIPSNPALPKHMHKGSEGTATEKANPKSSLSLHSCFLSLQTLQRNQVLGTGNYKANALCWWAVREVSLVLSCDLKRQLCVQRKPSWFCTRAQCFSIKPLALLTVTPEMPKGRVDAQYLDYTGMDREKLPEPE